MEQTICCFWILLKVNTFHHSQRLPEKIAQNSSAHHKAAKKTRIYYLRYIKSLKIMDSYEKSLEARKRDKNIVE